MSLQETIERVLALSRADGCVVIARHDTSANVRWANNTVTTNGAVEQTSLSIASIVGRRVASITRTYFPAATLESLVRQSEAACALTPEAADYQPLLPANGAAPDWDDPPAATGIHVFDAFAPRLGQVFHRTRRRAVQTFGYAEHTASTLWLATSSMRTP